MADDRSEIQELRSRVERLEAQVIFLSRRMGIEMQGVPKAELSPKVLELIRQGKKTDAIRQFVSETGASLKDAKTIIEGHKI